MAQGQGARHDGEVAPGGLAAEAVHQAPGECRGGRGKVGTWRAGRTPDPTAADQGHMRLLQSASSTAQGCKRKQGPVRRLDVQSAGSPQAVCIKSARSPQEVRIQSAGGATHVGEKTPEPEGSVAMSASVPVWNWLTKWNCAGVEGAKLSAERRLCGFRVCGLQGFTGG